MLTDKGRTIQAELMRLFKVKYPNKTIASVELAGGFDIQVHGVRVLWAEPCMAGAPGHEVPTGKWTFSWTDQYHDRAGWCAEGKQGVPFIKILERASAQYEKNCKAWSTATTVLSRDREVQDKILGGGGIVQVGSYTLHVASTMKAYGIAIRGTDKVLLADSLDGLRAKYTQATLLLAVLDTI